MPDKILIKEQGVSGLAIKSCQEHVHNKEQVDLREVFLLHTLGDILAVSVELAEIIIRPKHFIVIFHAGFQMFRCMFIRFFFHVLVSLISEYCRDPVPVRVMLLHILIVFRQGLDFVDREDCRVYIVILKPGTLREMAQDII